MLPPEEDELELLTDDDVSWGGYHKFQIHLMKLNKKLKPIHSINIETLQFFIRCLIKFFIMFE
jgi:hypothetical protein